MSEPEGAASPPPQSSLRADSSPSRGSTEQRDGQVFRDCAECPEMVVIPGGSFLMGSPESEAGRESNEGPQRRVTIARLAVGKFEVTRGQWAAFVSATGRPHPPNDCYISAGQNGSWRNPGFAQTDTHPVACVNWTDAQEYVRWLSGETGQRYRLLSEAEWEYAARAGTTTAYSTGSSIDAQEARFNANSTVAVGSFAPNQFGLYDMHGNVWEWTQDCYANSYSGLPTNGSAYETNDCSNRVYRGGGWSGIPQGLRSALRFRNSPAYRGIDLGFRVSRTVGATFPSP